MAAQGSCFPALVSNICSSVVLALASWVTQRRIRLIYLKSHSSTATGVVITFVPVILCICKETFFSSISFLAVQAAKATSVTVVAIFADDLIAIGSVD